MIQTGGLIDEDQNSKLSAMAARKNSSYLR
jgi:hypothetical protein